MKEKLIIETIFKKKTQDLHQQQQPAGQAGRLKINLEIKKRKKKSRKT